MITLTIPPSPESMSVLRATAGAIAARASLTLDQVEDVRMAVEEAGMLLLAAGTRITMSADPDVVPFVVEVSTPDGAAVQVLPESLPWLVLSGVTDRVDVTQEGGVTALRMEFIPVVAGR